jgi:hypothetical protein
MVFCDNLLLDCLFALSHEQQPPRTQERERHGLELHEPARTADGTEIIAYRSIIADDETQVVWTIAQLVKKVGFLKM